LDDGQPDDAQGYQSHVDLETGAAAVPAMLFSPARIGHALPSWVVLTGRSIVGELVLFSDSGERKWNGVAEELEKYLVALDVSKEDAPGALDRLRPRWERLGAPFELNIPFEVPGPLTPEQQAAINNAIELHLKAASNQFKAQSTEALLDFARMEAALLNPSS
jgi:hypothetical protein